MSDLDDAIADANTAVLDVMGISITYTPLNGAPFAASCFLSAPAEQQSTTPGYFGDIQVDPTVVVNPLRHDTVTWSNGTNYTVGRVVRPPRGFTVLALHRIA